MLPSADFTDNPAASDKPTSSGEAKEDTNAVVSLNASCTYNITVGPAGVTFGG